VIITRTWSLVDNCGNAAVDQVQTITVQDNTAPTFTRPADITIYRDGSCGYDASVGATGDVTDEADNCGVGQATYSDAVNSTDPCNVIITRTWSLVDNCGNAAVDQVQTITVQDNTAPTLAGTPYAGTTGTNACLANAATAAPFNATDAKQGYSDNCDNDVTAILTGTNVTGNDCAWTVTYTFKVVDNCGNELTDQSYSNIGSDQTPPTAMCQNISVTLGTGGSVTIAAVDVDNGSSDNCGQPVTLALDKYTFTDAEVGTATCSKVFTVKLTATDACSNTNTCNAQVTVNKRQTSIDYTGDNTEQYSDHTTLKAVLTDMATGDPLSGKTIKFTIGTQCTTAVTNGSGVAETTMHMYQNVGDYDVTASYAGDGPYCSSTTTEDYDILKENAVVEYTGPEFVSVYCNTSTCSTTVVLSASVKDYTAVYPGTDPYPGDIRKARVKFYDVNTNADISGWLTPGLVNPADTTAGVVSYNWVVPVPSSGGQSYAIGVKVDCNTDPNPDEGNYIGSAQATLNVCRSNINEFITGGGHIKPTASNGQYPASPNLKLNFGFNVKWNKSLKNLQGNVNIIYRTTTNVYQIKSTSMTSLSINSTDPCSKKAIFISKANLQDVTNPNIAPVAILGGLTLQLHLTDNGEPGNNDKIGVTLWNGNTLVFSSNWVSTQTVEMILMGGNIVVHNGVNCPNNTRIDNTITAKNAQMESTPEVLPFSVKAYPNPTGHQFTLVLEGASNEKVQVLVYDVVGRQVKMIERGDGSTPIRFGEDLKAGAYLVEVRQGDNRKTLKLVKQ
jgi:hypothetical protein